MFELLQEAATSIATRTGQERHDVALVLGSGLSPYAASLPGALTVQYADIPHFPVPTVQGHAGHLASADLSGVKVLAFAGRTHLYEDRPLDDIVFAVRTAILTGCHTVLLTNASGGCSPDLAAGDLVLITDHLNLTATNPLMGPNDERLGTRFPDLTEAYSKKLRAVARETAARVDVDLKEGVYAWFTGPSYETPAEVEMARRLGADLVGMSTVPEVIAARHMGARVLAISLCTNLAAGISPTPLSHDEVKLAADRSRDRFTRLLDAVIPAIGTR